MGMLCGLPPLWRQCLIMGQSWVVVVLRDDYCVPFKDFLPVLTPRRCFSMPGRLSSGSGLAPRGRGEACQRSLGNHPRSGSWLYSRLFLVDLTSDCWRPLIILATTNEFALLTPFPKNSIILCCFSSERGFFSSSFGSGNRVFSDPITSILMNAFEDPRQRGRSIHSAPCIFWSVGRSPALCQVSSQWCLRGHTLQRYAFSAIWTIGSFVPPWGEKPDRRSSRCPPIVTSTGLWSPRRS